MSRALLETVDGLSSRGQQHAYARRIARDVSSDLHRVGFDEITSKARATATVDGLSITPTCATPAERKASADVRAA